MNERNFDLTKTSIFAGVLIAIAGYVYLTVGGVIGAVMFAFGLMSVCCMGLNLYTGKAGSVCTEHLGWKELGMILLFNFVGTIVTGLLLSQVANQNVWYNLDDIIINRYNAGIGSAFVKAMFCGMIMEIAVYLYKHNGTYLGIIFGVPLFILCGFYHSIADSFYYAMYIFAGGSVEINILLVFVMSVIGNLAGCNIRRFLCVDDKLPF